MDQAIPFAAQTTLPLQIDRRTHPLKAWRMTQRIAEPGLRATRTMRVADAARGAGVPYQTWDAWEKDEEEAGHRKPDADNLRKIFLFTRGAVRPDHFYPIDEWRRQLAEQQEAEAAALSPAGEA